ncbi:MAG: hypothetical protein NUV81_04255 [bacterium]|nr:hypothetical protein [bacterium]
MYESMPKPPSPSEVTPESKKEPTQSFDRKTTDKDERPVESFETPPMTRAPSFAYNEARPRTDGTEDGGPPDLGEKPAFIKEAEVASPNYDRSKDAGGVDKSGMRYIDNNSESDNTRTVPNMNERARMDSSVPESTPDTEPYSDSPETEVVEVSPEWNGPDTEVENEDETAPDTIEVEAPTLRQMPADMEGPDSFDENEADAIRAGMDSPLADPLATHKKEEEELRKGWKATEPIEPVPTTLRSSDIPQSKADENVIRGMGTIPISREATEASPAVLEEDAPEEKQSAWSKFWDSVRGKGDDNKVA